MKILVTGGAGFIGSHVVDLFVERGHDVTVLDNLDPQVHGPNAAGPRHLGGHIKARRVRFLKGDVTDRASLQAAVDGNDIVVHLAAAVGVGQSMYEPHYYVHTNAGGTGLLLDLVAHAPASFRKLVVASSMSLYGEGAYSCRQCGRHELGERTRDRLDQGRWEVPCAQCGSDMEPRPTPEVKAAEIASVYAATKKVQEDLFVSFGRAYGIPTFALRFFNVFGPRQSLNNPYTGVAAIFLSRLLNGRAPLVFEDGRQTRDFIDVRDAARAVLLATEHEGGGQHVLNVGTGRATTVAEISEAIGRALGVDVHPEMLRKYRSGDVRHCYSDPSKIAEVLGFRAQYGLVDGLPALIEWCRNERAEDRVEQSLGELAARRLVQ